MGKEARIKQRALGADARMVVRDHGLDVRITDKGAIEFRQVDFIKMGLKIKFQYQESVRTLI